MDAASPPSPHRAPWGWIILAVVIALFWFWQRGDNAPRGEVEYSTVMLYVPAPVVGWMLVNRSTVYIEVGLGPI